MNRSYKNPISQWLKESLEVHHSTSIEISKQLNLNTNHSVPHQERMAEAFKIIETLDSFLTTPPKTQSDYPKTYQKLFQRLDNLYFDYMVTQIFSDQLNQDSLLNGKH